MVSLLPSFLKIGIYRHLYGYSIGRGVRIGAGTFIVGVQSCRIDDGVRIGFGNLFIDIESLEIGHQTRIGHFNVFRGGRRVTLGEYVTILRGNVFNSGLLNDFITPRDPELILGRGTFVATGHWIDFTDRVTFGEQCIIGGRASSLWTHNRQRTRSVSFGDQCYLGSDIRVAPGVEVASQCIISLGSVLMGRFEEPRTLIMGNPASVSRELTEQDLYHVTRKTREDLPDPPMLDDENPSNRDYPSSRIRAVADGVGVRSQSSALRVTD
ncbi:MAG: hypothetical protein KDA86_07850 [Planctomycetaceae bacterium]|nr:hypothetical protein [Planctomycetaceae bacterium]